jgi:hypothetical protein
VPVAVRLVCWDMVPKTRSPTETVTDPLATVGFVTELTDPVNVPLRSPCATNQA